ncbi:Hypothetical predicted protein [Drosophila guanche]|uniref:Uncharacterized protein n=1 Tax=Drosophila guanche TaxID=7266 RepID=A0A3B0JH81_DROGU|nr:Hypothetical predicted protein [Drosophila guanche]
MSVLWLLMLSGLQLLLARGEVLDMANCSKLMNTQKLDWCCGRNILSMFAFIGSNCTPYLNDYGPCRYDCLFHHWDIRDQLQFKLKMPELFVMITRLYSPLNGYQSYGLALKKAYETCDRLGTKYADFILLYSEHLQQTLGLANFTANNPNNCSPFSMYHAQCAAIYLTLDCPVKYWEKEEQCSILRETVRSCVRIFDESTPERSEPQTRSAGSRLYKLSGYAPAQFRLTRRMAKHRALLICCSLSATLLLVGAVPAPAVPDVDCARRQDFNAIKGCCSIPTFNFEAFRKQCGKHMPDGGPRVSPVSFL